MENYMAIALKEAKKAQKHGDVPIGAVIVKNNKIIAKGHNQKEKKKISTKHAEIVVIEKACKKLKTWHLDDCKIYTTVEPCIMCYGAIEQSRIKKIVYGTSNENFGYLSNIKKNKDMFIMSETLNEECSNIVKEFFNLKRL